MTAHTKSRRRSEKPSNGGTRSGLDVVCRDGLRFSFTEFAALDGMVHLVAEAFVSMLSTSEDPDSRIQTNRGRYYKLRLFLRWASGLRHPGRIRICRTTIQEFHQHLLKSDYGGNSVWHYVQTVRHVARILIDEGHIEPFLIPENLSLNAALAEGKGSRTLADLCPELPDGISQETADEELMRMLLVECDRRARELEARIEQGKRWRDDVLSRRFTPPLELNGQPFAEWELSRTQLLELACKLAIYCWDGEVPSRRCATRFGKTPEERLFHSILWGKADAGLRAAGSTTIQSVEVRTYLAPTTEYLAVLQPILAASGITAHSIRRLRVDQLDLGADPSGQYAEVVFDKPRAGGEVRVGPFMVGEPGALSLPRVWERILKATEELRARVSKGKQATLLICTREKRNWRCDASEMRAPIPSTLAKHILRPMLSQCDGESRPLRTLASKISAKVIRTTAINIANRRLDRDSDLSAMLFGHQPAVLDVTYLINPRVRADLERWMAEGQAALDAWLRAPISVVPNRLTSIRAVAGVDQTTAVAVLRGELSGLNGLCLMHDRALVVDTPLNCLRMIQWLRQLHEAEHRMQRDQPTRWQARYAPQLALFEDAINDFSRRNRRAAEALDRTHLLPMEEIA